jgi:hypothetical protein
MPEVPDSQAPSSEEVKLSNDIVPPSELDIDKETVQQQPDETDQPSQVPPSEGGNVIPVEPVEGLKDPSQSKQLEYKEGQYFSFTAPNGESYGITVTKVEGDQITLQNSTPGTTAVTLPLEQAKEILESPARA